MIANIRKYWQRQLQWQQLATQSTGWRPGRGRRRDGPGNNKLVLALAAVMSLCLISTMPGYFCQHIKIKSNTREPKKIEWKVEWNWCKENQFSSAKTKEKSLRRVKESDEHFWLLIGISYSVLLTTRSPAIAIRNSVGNLMKAFLAEEEDLPQRLHFWFFHQIAACKQLLHLQFAAVCGNQHKTSYISLRDRLAHCQHISFAGPLAGSPFICWIARSVSHPVSYPVVHSHRLRSERGSHSNELYGLGNFTFHMPKISVDDPMNFSRG